MRLRNIVWLFFSVLFAVDVAFAIVCVSATIRADQENFQRSTSSDFERIFRANSTELVANLTLGHERLITEQLRRIARREKLGLRLGDIELGAGTLRNPDISSSIARDFAVVHGGASYGTLTLFRSRRPYFAAVSEPFVFLLVGHLALLACALAVLLHWTKRGVVRPFEAIVRQARGENKALPTDGMWVCKELNDLSDNLASLRTELKQKTRKLASAEVATQVAHDIRSPLAALEIVTTHSAQLPEEMRLLVRTSVSRIRDIANTLLSAHRGKAESEVADRQPHMLCALVDLIATEKRVQHGQRLDLRISAQFAKQAYGAFALVGQSDFKRLISNLIENAVGAVGTNGHVRIEVRLEAEHLVVAVHDNGRGIPPEVLSKLGARGATFGKSEGNGLGLYHAFQMAQSWGGNLKLESAVEGDSGTTVSLSVPKIAAPKWFQSALHVSGTSTVVVVDDDTSIHEVWRQRFIRHPKPLLHFSTAQEFVAWYRDSSSSDLLLLFDYELADRNETGLDLIESFGLAPISSLVTSHFESRSIRQRCEKLGVKIVPKNLAGFIPIGYQACTASTLNAFSLSREF